jgi:DNA-binding transcriptional regulator GbsR (MarR family)
MTLSLEEKETAKNRRHQNSAEQLSPLQAEVISLFVQLSRVVGQPRSLGEIYGLLFISPRPLALDHLIDQLGMSKASASMGLKFLRNAGALKMVYVPGDRRVHYEAVAELRHLASRFLRDQIVPHLDSSLYRLEHIAKLVKQLPAEDRARVKARVTILANWEKKSRKFLPVFLKILGA